MNEPKQEINKRVHPRRVFEFLVLEHRPKNNRHPQASRTLTAVDFSEGGLKLSGKPRYDKCNLTLSLPHDGSRTEVEVEKVYEGSDDTFGVKFVNPSPEFLEKLNWWR